MVTISFAVGTTFVPGDYVRLFGDGGTGWGHLQWGHFSWGGGIDYNAPVDARRYFLFGEDENSGYFGWGRQSWGHFPFGSGQARNVSGWGHLPWGNFPFGRGTAIIHAHQTIVRSGTYGYAFKAYDAAGNVDAGTPSEASLEVCLTPQTPPALKKVSYDKDNDTMTFAIGT